MLEIFLSQAVVTVASVLLILFLLFYLFRVRHAVLAESADKFFVILRWSIVGFAAMLFFRGMFFAVLQYLTWRQVNPGLLPPNQPLQYFIGYAWMHFFKAEMVAILFALALLLVMLVVNKLVGNRFFYREEPWLAGFGVIASPWPAGMIAMMLVLIVGTLLQAGMSIVSKKDRLSLIWLWLPAALIAVIFGDIISKWVGLSRFII